MVGLEAEHLNIINVKSIAMQPFDLCLCRSFVHARPSRAGPVVAHSLPSESMYVCVDNLPYRI